MRLQVRASRPVLPKQSPLQKMRESARVKELPTATKATGTKAKGASHTAIPAKGTQKGTRQAERGEKGQQTKVQVTLSIQGQEITQKTLA